MNTLRYPVQDNNVKNPNQSHDRILTQATWMVTAQSPRPISQSFIIYFLDRNNYYTDAVK